MKSGVRIFVIFILATLSVDPLLNKVLDFGGNFVQAQEKALPHYFPPGIIQPTIPAQQWAEYFRYLMAAQKAFESDYFAAMPLIPNGVRVEREIEGKKITLVLDHHVKLPDNRITFTSYLGQQLITPEQLKVVIEHTFNEIQKAVNRNFAFYQNNRQLAVKALAQGLEISSEELEKILSQKVAENPRFTNEEFFWIPKKTEKKDFVPREIHLGYGPFIFGAIGFAWLDSELAYLTFTGQILDYMMAAPLVTQHEIIHTNKNLQSLPFSESFDVELFASIPEFLDPNDHLHLQGHGYLGEVRELAWVYFGYDFKRARKEVVKFDAGGNLLIDEEKFNYYAKLRGQVKEELLAFFPEAIAEFYSKIVPWAALQDKLVDKNAVLKIMMRAKYEPTILGGREKTARWIKAHEENTRADAETAWKKSGEKDAESDEGFGMLTQLATLLGVDIDNPDQANRFLKKYGLKKEELLRMNRQQIVILVIDILKKMRAEGGRR